MTNRDNTRFILFFFLLFAAGAFAQPGNTRPVLLTFGSMYPYSVVEEMGASNAIFHPVYEFGILHDTVVPGSHIYLPPELIPNSSCLNRDRNDFRDPVPDDFSIELYLNDTVDVDYSPYGQDSMTFVIAFPIIVTNQSPDTLFVGYCSDYYSGNISLILEGKDENGNWQSLETHYNYRDKTDKALVLPGRQSVVTSGFFYTGSFETDLRFRLGASYSATYRGWVNPEAFP